MRRRIVMLRLVLRLLRREGNWGMLWVLHDYMMFRYDVQLKWYEWIRFRLFTTILRFFSFVYVQILV